MSDIKARREARRRKILENSENRLKKIASNTDNLGGNLGEFRHENRLDLTKTLNHQRGTTSINADDQLDYSHNRVFVQNDIVNHVLPEIVYQAENQGNNDIRTIYQNPVPDYDSVSEVEFESFEEKSLILRNWVIIFLALVVRYLFLISEQYAQIIETDVLIRFNLNKIFIPFFVFEITEFIFFRPFIPQTGVLNMLFMLNLSLPTERIQKIITCFRVITRVVRDLMVYFFTFVCFDQLLDFVLQDEQIAKVP